MTKPAHSEETRVICQRFGLDYLRIEWPPHRGAEFSKQNVSKTYSVFKDTEERKTDKSFYSPLAEWAKDGNRFSCYLVPKVKRKTNVYGGIFTAHELISYDYDFNAMKLDLIEHIKDSTRDTTKPCNEKE